MTENFASMLEESFSSLAMQQGSVVQATIIDIHPDRITLDVGLKSEAVVSSMEFRGEEIEVGGKTDVIVKAAANSHGETVVSHVDAKRARDWIRLEKLHNDKESVLGTIVERVKGGFTVELDSVRAFLPGSLVDVKPVRDSNYLENKELEFKIIKMDKKRNNVVVSRRAVMEAENSAERSARLDELQEGQEVMGVVKNVTDYGAFLDLGGVDGLLHITDMAWKRVKHPSELINVGDELKVKLLKFDREKNRVSLGIKQLGEDPWLDIARRYPAQTRMKGRVTNITDYGCFVELEDGVEGLVHMSEMDWTNKNIHPNKVVQLGQEVDVIVLEIDEDRRRISLGIKQCKSNPWLDFSSAHEKDEKVTGNIRSITDFGMFIGLDGGIDGLVHLSDISWTEAGEDAVRNYKKGDEVTAIILSIDSERERISLGIKQLESDPIAEYVEGIDKDSIIKAKVISVDAKQAELKLTDEVNGIMRLADYSHDRIKDLRNELTEGEEVDVKVVNFDTKNHQVLVSHKVLEKRTSSTEESESSAKTTLGDLLKEQMQQKDD
ncbi:MAG: 30S ribosomal protein S1 [Gammaproteobacteria bacterium]|nr:30S ribosomal protein S1 [Gammaproteobacteria bacterium]